MKQLVEVIKIIAEKYIKDVNLILDRNKLTLEYLTIKYNEVDVYKTVEIEEFEDKLKITLIPERDVKIITVADIEDVLLTLEKQSKAKKTYSKRN